jgi:hypothetical protein
VHIEQHDVSVARGEFLYIRCRGFVLGTCWDREAEIDEQGILKVSAVSPKIKRDEGKCHNRREYRDRDCPIDMLPGAASSRHNRGEGFETDFPQLAHRSAGRLIDCHQSLALFGEAATLSCGPCADMAGVTPLTGVAKLLRMGGNRT